MAQKYSKKGSRRSGQKRLLPLLLALGGLALLAVVLVPLLTGRNQNNNQKKAAIEVQGAPSLKVDKEQVDLGEVKLGQPVKVSFELTNVGDQPLRLSELPYIEVREGC